MKSFVGLLSLGSAVVFWGLPGGLLAQPLATVAPENRILVQAWAEVDTVISSPIVGLIQKITTQVGQRFEKDEVLIRFEC